MVCWRDGTSTGTIGAIALGSTLPFAIGTVGATPLHPAKTLDCAVGESCCIAWAMGECGQGGNPDGVLYCCRVGACTCAAILGATIGALTLPCKLISSSSTIFNVGCPLICHRVTKVWYHNSICFTVSPHKSQLLSMPCATCRLLKYYNKFVSRVRSLVPSHTLCGSYLSCPASSCYLPHLSPLNSVFSIGQSLLVSWLYI